VSSTGVSVGSDGTTKSGFVALLGRPNSGKSTLVNALVGTKVAIVSDKPQTTRHRLRAVLDREDGQVVFVDTPGLHKPLDALGEELNRSALLSVNDVDVICFLVDATEPVGRGDRWVAKRIAKAKTPTVLVVTKCDLVDEETVEARLAEGRKLLDLVAEIAVSSVSGRGLEALLDGLVGLLPKGPRYFPRDMTTDQSLETMIAEFVREKVLLLTHEEVPHAVGVAVEDMEFVESSGTTVIRAVIYVERESQKGIIIGSKGSMIKEIGVRARKDLERMLGGRVHLELRVKVKKDWRRDAAQIRRFGYGEGL